MDELAAAKAARTTERIERVNGHTSEVVALDGDLARTVIREASIEPLAAFRHQGGEDCVRIRVFCMGFTDLDFTCEGFTDFACEGFTDFIDLHVTGKESFDGPMLHDRRTCNDYVQNF